MKIRPNTLWRVPVFCSLFSVICFYITLYLGGFFFTVQTPGSDGTIALSIDPLRSAIFNGGLFLLVLLIGGLWEFRSMTKAEIAISASILVAFHLTVTIAQLLSDFPVGIGIALAYIQTWQGNVSSFLLKLTNNFEFSVTASCFAPFLFVPFGKKA